MNVEFMSLALKEAEFAFHENNVPVGAILVKDGVPVCSASNGKTAISHAELLAIEDAIRILKCNFLNDCDLYVTLEPCAMCAQAISFARIKNLYFGAYDLKYGAIINNARVLQCALHKPSIIGGILETDCARILQNFFRNKRKYLKKNTVHK